MAMLEDNYRWCQAAGPRYEPCPADYWKDDSIRYAEGERDKAIRESVKELPSTGFVNVNGPLARTHPPEDPAVQSLLEREFNQRAERWKKQTSMHSSLTTKFMHEDYQSIMAMGEQVIPLILRRLQKAPDHWFWALKHLARGEDAARDTRTMSEATEAWLKWGREKRYIN
jgi:hypothetical protein